MGAGRYINVGGGTSTSDNTDNMTDMEGDGGRGRRSVSQSDSRPLATVPPKVVGEWVVGEEEFAQVPVVVAGPDLL